MTEAYDILLDDDGDILINENGDISIGQSDEQHIQDILEAVPGFYVQNPLVGANIGSTLNGVFDNAKRREVRLQLETDGYRVGNLIPDGESLTIEALRP